MQRLHSRGGVVVDDGANDDEPGLMVAVKAAKVGLPAAPALSLDRLGFRDVGEGVGSAANLVLRALAPHPLLFWRCAVGAHQPLRVGRPRSGRGLRAY